jgi:CRP-like cAMP-binding protein
VQVNPADLVDRLAAHKTLGTAPREELEWLASHGSLRQLSEGEVLTRKGTQVAGLFVVLSGQIAIYIDRGAGRHKLTESRAGDVTGMLPYSRLVTPPADAIAQEPTEILAVPRDELQDLTRACPETTTLLVHVMLDRVRGRGDQPRVGQHPGDVPGARLRELVPARAAIEIDRYLSGQHHEEA